MLLLCSHDVKPVQSLLCLSHFSQQYWEMSLRNGISSRWKWLRVMFIGGFDISPAESLTYTTMESFTSKPSGIQQKIQHASDSKHSTFSSKWIGTLQGQKHGMTNRSCYGPLTWEKRSQNNSERQERVGVLHRRLDKTIRGQEQQNMDQSSLTF
jgi:hypothetical protein